MSSLVNQRNQQVERAWTQRDRNLVLQQPTLVELQLERTEAIASDRRGRSHGRHREARVSLSLQRLSNLTSRRQTIDVNLASDPRMVAWDNCRMFHETKLPSIRRVDTQRVELAQALNLDDESEIATAVEDISHVIYSALLVFREVDRLASEAKQRQALQRLLKAPTLTLALLDKEDARVVNRIALHLPKRVELPKGFEPSPDQIKTAIAAAVATLGPKKKGRSPGTMSLAQRQFALGLAVTWVNYRGLPPTRRYDFYKKKEYGPFFDFVELVLSLLPVRFRSMKIKGNLKRPRSLVTMACREYRLAKESGDPTQLRGNLSEARWLPSL
jgi:hypothetical protein